MRVLERKKMTWDFNRRQDIPQKRKPNCVSLCSGFGSFKFIKISLYIIFLLLNFFLLPPCTKCTVVLVIRLNKQNTRLPHLTALLLPTD